MWFMIAFCLNPKHWRIGQQVREDAAGSRLVTWWCAGPIAFAAEHE